MSTTSGIRIERSVAVKERQLREFLGGGDTPLFAREDLEDAQVLGSLELSSIAASWEEVKASRGDHRLHQAAAALRRAHGALAPDAEFSIEAVKVWHQALTGRSGFRRVEASPDEPVAAPPALIEDRLQTLAEWVESPSGARLKRAQQGALVMARILEIRPFETGNGRIARVAASHLVVRAGGRPPILVGADSDRLRDALAAAFACHTEPLVALLDEASTRALDVLIQSLSRARAGG